MAWNQVGRLAEIGLSFLFTVLIVRQLSQLSFGDYNTLITLVTFVSYLVGLGLSDSLARFVAGLRSENELAPFWLLRRFLQIRLGASLSAAALLVVGRNQLAAWLGQPLIADDAWLLALLILLYNLVDLLGAYYNAYFWVGRIVAIRLSGQMLNIGLVLLFFWLNRPDPRWLLLSLFVSNLLMLAACLAPLLDKGVPGRTLGRPRSYEAKKIYSYSRDLWLSNFVTLGLLGQVDILVLAWLANDPLAVPFYSLAGLLVARLWALALAWTGSLGSIAATVLLEQGQPGLARYFHYYYRFSLPLNLIPMVGLAAVSPALLTVFFGERYRPVALLISLFVVQQILDAMLGAGIVIYFVNTLGRQKADLGWRCLCSLLNLTLDLALAGWLGAVGVVLATVIANGLLHLLEAWLVRELFTGLELTYTLKVSASILGAGGLSWWMPGEGLPGLVLKSLIYLAALALVFRLVRPISQADKAFISEVRPGLARFIQYF